MALVAGHVLSSRADAAAAAAEGARARILAGAPGAWRELASADADLRDDRDVVLAAVRAQWRAIRHASPRLQVGAHAHSRTHAQK